MDFSNSSSDGESSEAILSIINHVFLPPQLPDHGDKSKNISHGSALTRLVISSLREFRCHVSSARLLAVDDAEKAMIHFQSIRDETGSIDEQGLTEVLNSHVYDEDKILPLHITAQNAGIIITQNQISVVLEAFELSPTNKAVMGTTGRLRRNFPASSISITIEKFREDGFINALAGTLRTMSHQEVTEAKPKILKKGESQIEERDTTNPFLVTDFLQTVLLAHGKETKPVSSICKNTREEVIWKDALMPWRRSPVWLLLRVTLQLIFERLHSDRLLYKEYMIFLMTHALNMALKRSFRSDLLYCMLKKIGRRLKKLGDDIEMSWVNNLRFTIKQTMDCLQKRWNRISREPETELDVVEWSEKLLPADGSEPYPELDVFIGGIDGRRSENYENQFKAPWVLRKYDESGIPDLNDLIQKCIPFHLSAMEEWAESSLPLWMRNTNEYACNQLYDLAKTYYDLSQKCYSGCPESLSIASLTILELWMTCDKFVCDRISLVREYSPQIPVNLLQSLLLHSKSHLERLVRVEEYISRRCNGTLSDIFSSFGSKTSFSVRYYETSAIHQKLRRDIEQNATKERDLKRKEFYDKSQLYHRLKSQSSNLICEYDTRVDHRTGIRHQQHSGSCKKHSLLRQAEELSIEAQSAVFELNVPSSFSAWRDMTTLVINYVLECDYTASQDNRIVNRLSSYLSSQFSGAIHRLELGSTTKSNKQTHRHAKKISTCSEEGDVLVKNGLRYEYYDNYRQSFVSDFQNENNYSRNLMFKLPPGQENGLTPNHVLSRQYYYSQKLSLEESKALATLPLFTPKIDFNKPDTAGPPRDLSMHRASHQQLCDESFVKRLLEGLSHAIDRIYKNWESYISLRAFIAIAIKALNCAATPTLQQEYRQLLGRCRSVATNWINLLQKKLSGIPDEEQRQDFYLVISQVALICIAAILSDAEQMRMLIHSSVVVQNLSHGVGACTESFHVNLILQKNRVLYNSRRFIISETLDKMNQGLNLAVKATLRFYNEEGLWKLLSNNENHWLETKTTPRNGKTSLSIQFNILTGELLVNGLPPSRLPAIYEEHPVMPSDIPGTLFSSIEIHHGYTFAFGMNQSTPPQLILVASANDSTLDLIPRESLNHNLPTSFINDYVHWYNRESGKVEFRPANFRWCSSKSNWHLENTRSAWALKRPGQILLCPTSLEIRRICHNLRSLEQETHIHNILDNTTFALNISLPRLRLEFSLEQGSSELHCRQFRGMYVDKVQRIGTLVGLNSKLTLRDGQNKRMILVPDGDACYSRNAGHVRVEITHGSSNRVHPFTIDTRLGRLVDNGSLRSKLCIAYLHALTSYCLPDKLTGNTGTEQCLTILNSAAVRSFPQLLKEDLDTLARISNLSPGREYYPKEERVMETIHWDKEISFLSQPGSLHTTVLSIIEEANRNLVFHSEQSAKYTISNHVDTTLGLRHQIRDSTFYLSGFGAENHTDSKDVRYRSRDVAAEYTERSWRAFEAATMVVEKRQTIHMPISPTFALDMWKLLNNKSSGTQGPSVPLPVEEIGYDCRWLSEASSIFAEYWCRFHHNFGNKQQQPFCRFQLMFCAATMAYAENHNASAVQAAIACANIQSISSIEVPDVDVFDMPVGYQFEYSFIYNSTLENSRTNFMHSQEATLSRYSSYESDEELERRRYRTFENNRRDAVSDFTSKLQEQWICPIPVIPKDAGFSRYILTDNTRARILPTWKKWYENHLLFQYLTTLGDALRLLKVMEISTLCYAKPLPPTLSGSTRGFVNQEDLFSHCAPSIDIPSMVQTKSHHQLENLLDLLKQHASRDSEHKYIQNLEESQKCHSRTIASYEVTEAGESLSHILKEYLSNCETTNNWIYRLMAEATGAAYEENTVALRAHTTSAASIARYYMAPRLSLEWRKAIVAYAQSLTMRNNNAEFLKELLNTGHTNWNPLDYPESLLLENIASQMRNPPQGKNATMQLNMGEGKSTVILPTVAAYLADSSRLVVVICTKPQAKEMFRMLTSKLGGLMNHQVYQMPFSRTLRFTVPDAQGIFQTLRKCSETGGILLMQPEHLLSFKLMEVGQILLDIQHYFNNHSRTIVDESDDIFSVPIELSTSRWIIVQRVFSIVMRAAYSHEKGRFPRIRILRQDAEDVLLSLLVEEICAAGLPGLPIMRQPKAIREHIRDQINSVEGPLLLVRGQKRWRVNYGLDQGRDSPTTKSEFSHPDVVIELTQLTYYYGGLSDDDLFAVFDHLLRADQAEAQYQDWSLSGVTMKDRHQATHEIFPHFRHAKNTIDYFLSHLVFAKEMKEFPKKLSASGWDIGQLKAQPTTGFSGTCDSRNLMPLDMDHLDLMEQRHTNATVLQHILQPENSIALLPRVDEASDAEVLLNAVIQMEPPVQVILDVGAQILEFTNVQLATAWLKKAPEHQGKKAAIYFDDNDELCVIDQQGRVESFQTSPYGQQLDLCLVFLDESHTRGTDLKLPAYYRAAVTLGPGLTKDRLVQACMRLRKLGKGQSVVFCISEEIQAKILQLSKRDGGRSIQVADVLAWAIHETFVDLHRSIPMWAIQGQRFEKQRAIWESVTTSENIQLSLEKAKGFLEAEIQSLDDRYRPRSSGEQQVQPFNPEQNPRLDAIWKRCEEFGNTQLHSSALWEEQERELSPEIVQERQIERPPPVEPENHAIHPKLIELVKSGSFSQSAPFYPAFEAFGRTRAAQLLDISSFPDDVVVTQDFMSTVILERRDDNDDFYQRSVQWVLSQVYPNSTVERLVIISPHEAQELKPLIATSRHVHLHLYSPLASLAHTSLESLKLYTVPALPKSWHLPSRLRTLLNLFSGQLYINSEADYHEICKLLNLSNSTTKDGATVEPDGFIVSQSSDTLTKFKKSPVVFLKAFLAIRWSSELNDKTHWGTILAGDILEFQNSTYSIIGT
ncbi:hypothetical protein V8C35DRAFT_332985 [Trichoderma chlorosporum]